MKTNCLLLVALLSVLQRAGAAELTLSSPLDYQVVQRSSPGKGLIRITGELSEDVPAEAAVQVRVMNDVLQTAWKQVNSVKGRKIIASYEAPAGAWWKVEVQVVYGGKQLALGSVAHVGIGEVFVIAGQSNSANHGAERQATKTRRVASFDGKAWRIADDPQPGASGSGGSFIPPFADAVVAKENVPVGIIACGIGATSVREWLPKGATFPNPPTIMSRVEQLPDGQWASKGAAYDTFISRMKPLGPQGFRAVLWHQGESDANQKDATRTLSGKLYREFLEKIIRDSRRDIGWSAPWFVAQASYHVPGEESSDDIRAAQASLWKDGIALGGPDSDALKGKLRERDGKGVHFSGEGLRVHGAKWAEKVLPWLAKQLTFQAITAEKTVETDPRLHSDGKGWKLNQATSEDPKLPRVLLIGDSILSGYMAHAIKALDGKAYVDAWVNPYHQSQHLNDNILPEVLAKGPYDVIHFNMGLHGWPEGRIKPGTFEPLTKAYVEAIQRMLPKAKIIWASSTPVLLGGDVKKLDPVINGNILEQNRMAAKVMAECGVPVSDFYALLVDRLDLARGGKDKFHWTPPAYKMLGDKCVEQVLEALPATN